jgi:hypothetical protein
VRRLLWCGMFFFACSVCNADLLSLTSAVWQIPHGSEGAFSMVTLDGGNPHGVINAGVLQFGQPLDFNTTDTAGQTLLTSDLTNDSNNGVEFHYSSSVHSQNEFALVNQVPHLSAIDFAGYDISGYRVDFNSLISGPTTDTVGINILIFGDGGLGAALPEPGTLTSLMIGAACLALGQRRCRSRGV